MVRTSKVAGLREITGEMAGTGEVSVAGKEGGAKEEVGTVAARATVLSSGWRGCLLCTFLKLPSGVFARYCARDK